MGRPAEGYHLKDGTKVPGVTTILGRYKESGGLLWWANRLAFDPLEQAYSLLRRAHEMAESGVADSDQWQEWDDRVAQFLETPITNYDHTKARDKAADAGTLTHAMVEAYLLGKDPHAESFGHPADIVSKADTAFLGFLEWATQTKLRVVETELSMVSEAQRVGGTLDCNVIAVNDRLSIGDFKTGGAIYSDALIQIGQYAAMYEEHNPDKHIEGGYIFRFDKDSGEYTQKFVQRDTLLLGARAFALMRELFDLDKQLKKHAK